ncbi:MAG: polysaccharide biosynthesis/export family protein [Bacteroidales bacterium]|nr:polysaccharide biosynthesis/export family protein [Bacteroidales bacterium]
MNKLRIISIVSAAAMLMLTSCVTPRRVNYLQDMTQGTQIKLEHRFEAKIAPYDELSIFVSTSQVDQTLAAPFNTIGTPNGVGNRGSSYLVDVNGNIDFPVLGKLRVANLTRLQLQDTITAMLTRGGYLDDPYVNVRFNNFKIFFIGNGTGKVLTVENERCTFLEALAMSGGLDNYTRRDRIAVMREVDGRMVMRYLDPRSAEIFFDPFYMLQQNDFIITDGTNVGTLRTEVSYWTGLVSTLLTAASLITTIMLFKATKNN